MPVGLEQNVGLKVQGDVTLTLNHRGPGRMKILTATAQLTYRLVRYHERGRDLSEGNVLFSLMYLWLVDIMEAGINNHLLLVFL